MRILKGDLARMLKTKVERLPLISKVTQEFLEKMKECEDYLGSFGITDETFENADEKEFDASFRQFQNAMTKAK